jgi:hypothetical protein
VRVIVDAGTAQALSPYPSWVLEAPSGGMGGLGIAAAGPRRRRSSGQAASMYPIGLAPQSTPAYVPPGITVAQAPRYPPPLSTLHRATHHREPGRPLRGPQIAYLRRAFPPPRLPYLGPASSVAPQWLTGSASQIGVSGTFDRGVAGVGAFGVGAFDQGVVGVGGLGDGGGAAAGAAQGAIAGAAAGSVVPVVGTVIGAVVGAAAGYFSAKSAGKSAQDQIDAAKKIAQLNAKAANANRAAAKWTAQSEATRQRTYIVVAAIGAVAVVGGVLLVMRARRKRRPA